MTKNYILEGIDREGAFPDTITPDQAGEFRDPNVVLIKPRRNESIEQTLRRYNIEPGSNIILSAHGTEDGQFAWRGNDDLVNYGRLFSNLPEGSSIIIQSCYGSTASSYIDALPRNAMLASLDSANQTTSGYRIGSFISGLRTLHETEPGSGTFNTGGLNAGDFLIQTFNHLEKGNLPQQFFIGGPPARTIRFQNLLEYANNSGFSFSEGVIQRVEFQLNTTGTAQDVRFYLVTPPNDYPFDPAPFQTLNLGLITPRPQQPNEPDNQYLNYYTQFSNRLLEIARNNPSVNQALDSETPLNDQAINNLLSDVPLGDREIARQLLVAHSYACTQERTLEGRVREIAERIEAGTFSSTNPEDLRIAYALMAAQVDTPEGVGGVSLRPPTAQVITIGFAQPNLIAQAPSTQTMDRYAAEILMGYTFNYQPEGKSDPITYATNLQQELIQATAIGSLTVEERTFLRDFEGQLAERGVVLGSQEMAAFNDFARSLAGAGNQLETALTSPAIVTLQAALPEAADRAVESALTRR